MIRLGPGRRSAGMQNPAAAPIRIGVSAEKIRSSERFESAGRWVAVKDGDRKASLASRRLQAYQAKPNGHSITVPAVSAIYEGKFQIPPRELRDRKRQDRNDQHQKASADADYRVRRVNDAMKHHIRDRLMDQIDTVRNRAEPPQPSCAKNIDHNSQRINQEEHQHTEISCIEEADTKRLNERRLLQPKQCDRSQS